MGDTGSPLGPQQAAQQGPGLSRGFLAGPAGRGSGPEAQVCPHLAAQHSGLPALPCDAAVDR